MAIGATGGVPEKYYEGLDGKSGDALRDAVWQTAQGHKVVEYGEDTWDAFLTTDVIEVGTPLSYRQAWRDMYSNALVYTEQGHPGMNIEHSVPNSWWGGIKNDAYKDLFHLNPSNSTANNQKSNHPLGIVSDTYWTNGITTMGTAETGLGGGATRVFEPADEYKGDFARAYLYVFTVYDRMKNENGGQAWNPEYDWMYDTTDPLGIRPWAADLLLEWAANDPTDPAELKRNETIYGIQGCRNPFIDFPELGEYLYGEKSSIAFELSSARQAVGFSRPGAPVPDGFEMTGLNTYAGRWWNEMTVRINTEVGYPLWLEASVDGMPWEEIDMSGIDVGHATVEGETLSIRLRVGCEDRGYTLYSPTTFLTLTAKNPEKKDLKDAVWQLAYGIGGEPAGKYIIVAPKVGAVMSSELSKTFLTVAGNVAPVESNGSSYIKGVPEGTGVVTAKDVAMLDCEYGEDVCSCTLMLETLSGEYVGMLAPTAAKTMRLDDEGAACSVTGYTDPESEKVGLTKIDFGPELGRLQYNASAPRFLNYTSNQEDIALYALTDLTEIPGLGGAEGITISGIRVEDHDIIVPTGTPVYDLQGRRISPFGVSAGVYIAGGRKVLVKG